MARCKVGDIYCIPLSNNRCAICQYVYDDRTGPMIRVLKQIFRKDQEINLNDLNPEELLFPPIITGLGAAINKMGWKRIGFLPIESFEYPCFVTAYYDFLSGKARRWFLWKENHEVELGNELPRKYIDCEYMMVWSPQDVVKRIETGWYFPKYKEMMEKNYFTIQKKEDD